MGRGAGRSYRAALNRLHAGTLLVPARQLARSGVEHLEAALGRGIVVLDDIEVADDLVRDMTEVLTAICARLYGRRSASRRATAAVRAARAKSEDAP